jgi:hypothetical protein
MIEFLETVIASMSNVGLEVLFGAVNLFSRVEISVAASIMSYSFKPKALFLPSKYKLIHLLTD